MINNDVGCPSFARSQRECGIFDFSLVKIKIPDLSFAKSPKPKEGAHPANYRETVSCYLFSLFIFAQPSLTTCFARPNASESGGTSWVMHEAAATYAPLPTFTGATRVASLPMNAPSSMIVLCLFTPS